MKSDNYPQRTCYQDNFKVTVLSKDEVKLTDIVSNYSQRWGNLNAEIVLNKSAQRGYFLYKSILLMIENGGEIKLYAHKLKKISGGTMKEANRYLDNYISEMKLVKDKIDEMRKI